ncbi:hypothetical protein GCM10027446_00870 [Angustibacter peucedani]
MDPDRPRQELRDGGAVAGRGRHAVVRLRVHGRRGSPRLDPRHLWEGLPVEWDVDVRRAGPDLGVTVRLDVEADDDTAATQLAERRVHEALEQVAVDEATGWTVTSAEVVPARRGFRGAGRGDR